MHSFEVQSNERACRKKVRLGMEQVIIEGLPLPCDSPVRLVSGNFIDETMSTCYFFHVPIVLVEMHKESLSVENLPEGFGTAKFRICKV